MKNMKGIAKYLQSLPFRKSRILNLLLTMHHAPLRQTLTVKAKDVL
jgi:hypothetical protein